MLLSFALLRPKETRLLKLSPVGGGFVPAFAGETVREDRGDGRALSGAGDVGFSGGGGLDEEEEVFHASPARSSIAQKELRYLGKGC